LFNEHEPKQDWHLSIVAIHETQLLEQLKSEHTVAETICDFKPIGYVKRIILAIGERRFIS